MKPGDLYIGGVGLSPGYWNDPEKTREVFRRNPYSSNPSDRIYNTGDLARIGTDGLVYLIGRSDSQIKSRGYRIELGEIEAAVHAIAGVQDAAVVVAGAEGSEDRIICCAYVSRPGLDLSPLALKRQLTATLPRYMMPQRWMALDQMPRNGNGKTDRPFLKQQFEHDASVAGQEMEARTRIDSLRFTLEIFLAGAVMQEQLAREIARLINDELLVEVNSPEDDLLASGVLDSLTLVQLLFDLERRFGVTIPLEELEIDDFRSINSIASLVQSALQLQRQPGKDSPRMSPSRDWRETRARHEYSGSERSGKRHAIQETALAWPSGSRVSNCPGTRCSRGAGRGWQSCSCRRRGTF